MAPKGRGVFVANESGQVEIAGQLYPFTKGVTRVREGHVLLKNHGVFFDPVEDHVHYEVEQATAGPGERRGDRDPYAGLKVAELKARVSDRGLEAASGKKADLIAALEAADTDA